jgi:hypothetical protein
VGNASGDKVLSHVVGFCSNSHMTRLRDTLTVWLLVAARHWSRVAVIVLCLTVFVLASTANRKDWYGVAVGVVLGLGFGVVMAFGDELADALEK